MIEDIENTDMTEEPAVTGTISEVTTLATLPRLPASVGDVLPARPNLPPDQNPAAVYLAHLTPGGQRTMRGALDVIAALLSGGQADALTCNWAALRFQHTAALRAKLIG